MKTIDTYTEEGCNTNKSDKVCRSRGGESCAFDGAMIVLQPIADAAHLVHGPIACCGNSWEGRGSRSRQGRLDRMGFTTDLKELDIVYGAEAKLSAAIKELSERVRPKAIFVHATCVSGLIGEDIDSVCRKAGEELGLPVIPVNAPGFAGPKNLGNRIAGEVLLEHVIGRGEAPCPPSSPGSGDAAGVEINLIGEYNIAGDLWQIEPVLKRAGFRLLARMTGNATFEELTWAHQARLNVVVCSRALINVAKVMEKRYGIPYLEVSFFGKTEMARALRLMGSAVPGSEEFRQELGEKIEEVIAVEEQKLETRLAPYSHLKGKRAVLYTGGVKSWSFISALRDLGIEIVAVGTKKSTFEDEEKMKELLGSAALLVEDVAPKNLKKLLRERSADILIAGGRNQYLAVKEGYPFIDVNQERHLPYAGYEGLVKLAEQISASLRFYEDRSPVGTGSVRLSNDSAAQPLSINPLRHSASMGAAMALQGIHRALPVIHGAQGCTFLGKVLLTKHFREPIALAGTKLFVEDVVLGSDEALLKTLRGFIEKDSPELLGVLTSGLTAVKGDDVEAALRQLAREGLSSASRIIHIPTPDYEGGLETGYAKAVETLLAEIACKAAAPQTPVRGRITLLAGAHLTPADFLELREMAESFGLSPVLVPDLSCLDGSRQGISPLALGGSSLEEVCGLGASEFTVAVGLSLAPAAALLQSRFGSGCRIFPGLAGLRQTGLFLETLSMLSGRPIPLKYERQRRVLQDSMRDAHAFLAGRRVGLALEPDHALQTAQWLEELAAELPLVILPQASAAAAEIPAERIRVGDLSGIEGELDLLIAGSHAEDTAARLGTPLLQSGFPVYKVFGHTNRLTIGYRGTMSLVQEAATLLARGLH